jgi:hypothetical protein
VRHSDAHRDLRTYATIRGLEFRVQATIARSTSDARILPFS